jgi:hypothetical protein
MKSNTSDDACHGSIKVSIGLDDAGFGHVSHANYACRDQTLVGKLHIARLVRLASLQFNPKSQPTCH